MLPLNHTTKAAAMSAHMTAGAPRIVIPLDGSPFSERAVQPGSSLARALNAELTLVRAYGGKSTPPAAANGLGGYGRLTTDDVQHASLYLARIQADLRSHGVRASSRVVQARASEGILEVAAHTAPGVVVIATRGEQRTAPESVAADLVRKGDVPVLLVTDVTGNPFDTHQKDLRVAVIEDDLVGNARLRHCLTALAGPFSAPVSVLRPVYARRTNAAHTSSPENGVDGDDPLASLRAGGVDVREESIIDHVTSATFGAMAHQRRANVIVLAGHHAVPRPAETARWVFAVLEAARVPVLFIP